MSNDDRADARREWASETIRDLLTTERLGSYLVSAAGDLGRALELYDWNLIASAAVMQTTAIVEVVVRNALDRQLVSWAAGRGMSSWLDGIPLDHRGRADIAKGVERATRFGRAPRHHGKVVAELSFGFWRYLAAQRYHASLWVPALHRAFPGGDPDLRSRRRHVEQRLADLMLVRNRAAHGEPVHRRNLSGDLQAAVELLAWIHPDAGAWVAATSAIPAAVAARPASNRAALAAEWVARIAELAALRRGWLDPAADNPSRQALDSAEKLLLACVEAGLQRPSIYPSAEGGVQLEWRSANATVEVEILNNGKASAFSIGSSGGGDRKLVLPRMDADDMLNFVIEQVRG